MVNETENWIEFGLWVKRRREAKAWTQEELAKRAGFADRQTIYRIEAGASTKRASVLKIAESLGESADKALAIAFRGSQVAISEEAKEESDRAALAAFFSQANESLALIPDERRAQVLAFLKIMSVENPEALQILSSKFEYKTTEEIDQTKKRDEIEKQERK